MAKNRNSGGGKNNEIQQTALYWPEKRTAVSELTSQKWIYLKIHASELNLNLKGITQINSNS